MLIIIPESFTKGSVLLFPPDLLSTEWYGEVLTAPEWTAATSSSFKLTLMGAAMATVTGTAAALALHRRPGRSLGLTTWFLVPLVVPWIVYALGLYLFLDEVGLLGQAWAVAAGQAVLAFPLVFITVSAGLAAVNPALPVAARSLGSRWTEVVRRIELPLVRASVMGGALFALAYCFDEIVVALFVTTPEIQTLPVQIFQTARDSASPAIAAVSTMVMAGVVAVFGAGSAVIARANGRK
jgi:ABC-type spermidine/putrescine transport system permease subunit II